MAIAPRGRVIRVRLDVWYLRLRLYGCECVRLCMSVCWCFPVWDVRCGSHRFCGSLMPTRGRPDHRTHTGAHASDVLVVLVPIDWAIRAPCVPCSVNLDVGASYLCVCG